MVHPNVPAIVIVPVCAHSLSFRPIIIPAGVEIKVSAVTYLVEEFDSLICSCRRLKSTTTLATVRGCRTTVATACSSTKATREWLVSLHLKRSLCDASCGSFQTAHQHLHLPGAVRLRG